MSSGMLNISMRTLAAASSMRSMALSGKNRSVRYRCESLAAALSALSLIFRPWCASYLSRKPCKIAIVSSTVGSST